MKTAICDSESFYPLRRLVSGPFDSLDDLAAIERFIRTVVLHDEMIMALTPLPYDPETDFEQRAPGRYMVITALGPTLAGFDFFTDNTGPQTVPEIELAPALIEVAAQHANAGEGNAYFKTHVKYLKRVLGIVERGGSALLCSDFGQQVVKTAREYPESLFKQLDKDWQNYARSAQQDGLGLLVSPLLDIVLTRCARRNAIPTVIKELRDEWAGARRKVWKLLDALRACRTLGEAMKIRRELSDASSLFSPTQIRVESRPVRIFWNIGTAAGAGAAISQISGGEPVIGAATGAIANLALSMAAVANEFGPALFGRGAFDLANKVRHEASQVEFNALSRLLTETEKRKLGFL